MLVNNANANTHDDTIFRYAIACIYVYFFTYHFEI